MPGPVPDQILETAIYAADLGAADTFYGGLLQLEEVLREEGRHIFYRCGSTMLLVLNPSATMNAPTGPDAAPAHGSFGQGHICFSATRSELEDYRQLMEAAGFPIEKEITWPNGARSIYVRDPAGNSVEFAEARLWGVSSGSGADSQ